MPYYYKLGTTPHNRHTQFRRPDGSVYTQYGDLPFGYGDYRVLPRGTIYQIEFNDEKNRLFIVESHHPIRFPKKYLSKYGQLMEHSPYCERDIRPPQDLKTFDEKGDIVIKTKKSGVLYGIHYAHHQIGRAS